MDEREQDKGTGQEPNNLCVAVLSKPPLATRYGARLGVIEVYPHPALVELAGAAERLPYKAPQRFGAIGSGGAACPPISTMEPDRNAARGRDRWCGSALPRLEPNATGMQVKAYKNTRTRSTPSSALGLLCVLWRGELRRLAMSIQRFVFRPTRSVIPHAERSTRLLQIPVKTKLWLTRRTKAIWARSLHAELPTNSVGLPLKKMPKGC